MIFDNMKNYELYCGCHKNFKKGFEFIEKAIAENLPVGKYEIDGKELYASVQEYNSKLPQDGKFEGHQNYIDIQYVVWGVEVIEVADISKAVSKAPYNPEKDVEFYEDINLAHKCIIEAGEYGIFFDHDIHKPGLAFNESAPVKKIVVKVKI